MSRIEEIILEARSIIGDESADRFTNDTLMRYLNSGIETINKKIKFLKTKVYVKLENNISYYDLSPYALRIDRIQYLQNTLLPITSMELDRKDANWENTTGNEVRYVIFDSVKPAAVTIYPKITDNVLNIISANSLYGAIIDINYTDQLLEVPVDNIDSYAFKYLTVFCIKHPEVVLYTTIDTELEFDRSYDSALEHYIASKALRSNADTQNSKLSSEQVALFNAELSDLAATTSKNGNAVHYKDTRYRGFL